MAAPPPQPEPRPTAAGGPRSVQEVRSVPPGAKWRVYTAGRPWGLWCHFLKGRNTQPCRYRLTKGGMACTSLCKAVGVKWRCYLPLLERDSRACYVVVGGSRLAEDCEVQGLWSACLVQRGQGRTSRVYLADDPEITPADLAAGRELSVTRDPVDPWPFMLRLWGDRELAEYYGVTLAADPGTASYFPTPPPPPPPPPVDPPTAADAVGDVLAMRIRQSMQPAKPPAQRPPRRG